MAGRGRHQPWRHRSWIFPRGSAFAVKAERVLGLYERIFKGKALRDNEYVVSADEKNCIRARCRCHLILPGLHVTRRARGARVRPRRHPAILGCLGRPSRPPVQSVRGAQRHRARGRLVEQVMTVEPYASARRVFWVVDNCTAHRGQRSVDRLRAAWPNLWLIHLPSTPRGSTESRSTSLSSNVRCSPRTISALSKSSNVGSSTSSTATNRRRHRSDGSSRNRTWMRCSIVSHSSMINQCHVQHEPSSSKFRWEALSHAAHAQNPNQPPTRPSEGARSAACWRCV